LARANRPPVTEMLWSWPRARWPSSNRMAART